MPVCGASVNLSKSNASVCDADLVFTAVHDSILIVDVAHGDKSLKVALLKAMSSRLGMILGCDRTVLPREGQALSSYLFCSFMGKAFTG